MSKTKTVSENKDEVVVTVEEKTETKTETLKEKKMGVVRYLDENNQTTYIQALLKKFHALDFNTKEGWDLIVKNLLSKKITN